MRRENTSYQVETFVCFNDKETDLIRLRFRIYATLLAISAAFLGITFTVYIFLPKLLNLHGKTLVCHVLSLFVAYSFLSAVQFATDVRMTYCKCIGESSRHPAFDFNLKLKFPINFSLCRVLQLHVRYSTVFFHYKTRDF